MRVAEGLAIMGATAAIGGALGAAYELSNESEARETAISAQACLDTYSFDNGSASQAIIDCLKNGWVPGSEPTKINMKAGDPGSLFTGYVKEERAKGSHVYAPPIFLSAIGGAVAGFFIVLKVEQWNEEDRNKVSQSQPKHQAPEASTTPSSGSVNLEK